MLREVIVVTEESAYGEFVSRFSWSISALPFLRS